MDKFRDRPRKIFSVSLIAQIGCKCDSAIILQRMANAPDGDNGARTICVMSANEQTELVESHILTVPAHTKIVLVGED